MSAVAGRREVRVKADTTYKMDALDDIDAEDVSGVGAFHPLPSRVDAGIAANQASFVPDQAVRIARAGLERDGLQELAGFAVVLVHAHSSFSVGGAVVAVHHPDTALV